MVRLKDIAQHVGVSIMTVSKALRDAPDVSAATKANIKSIAQQMGYVPDSSAQGLRTKTTRLFGLLIPATANPVYARMVMAIEERAHELGYDILFAHSLNKPEREELCLRRFLSRRVDGLFISPVYRFEAEARIYQEVLASKTPVVLLGPPAAFCKSFASVEIEELVASYNATQHLIRLGHKQIAYLTGPPTAPWAHERFEGYRRALREAGLEVDDKLVFQSGSTIEDGTKAALQMLNEGCPATAVQAVSDLVAIGCANALLSQGLKIPEDISLVGFGNVLAAEYFRVPLTTIRQPKFRLGVAAVETMMSLIRGEKAQPKRLPAELIERKSTATPAGDKPFQIISVLAIPPADFKLLVVSIYMNYKISKRAASLAPSLTLAIDSKAKAMKAAGEDVVGFGAGEPDFDTPQHIKDAAAKALAAGFTKYTPSAGIPELREAIAAKFKRENGLTYKPSQIIVSCGGKHSCYNVILATCEEGDEVIIPAPYWLSYPEMVKLAGAKPVILETTDKTEFKVTPEQLRAAITPNTRLFILNSPSNPTGSVYTPEETKALGDICVEKNVLIMSDEIYEHLLYDGAKVKSVASFSQAHYDHTIIVHGLAKAYSMTGWRLGFLAAPEPIAKAIDAVQSHSTSNPTSFAQKGGVEALNGSQDHLPVWLAEYDKRRRYAHAKLNSIPGLTCVNAKGAFYLFPNISKTGLKSAEFCAKLLEQEKVAAVPGIAFGADDYIRLSYATSMANIEKGLARIEKFCKTLVK